MLISKLSSMKLHGTSITSDEKGDVLLRKGRFESQYIDGNMAEFITRHLSKVVDEGFLNEVIECHVELLMGKFNIDLDEDGDKPEN
jgi:hypothetical protein